MPSAKSQYARQVAKAQRPPQSMPAAFARFGRRLIVAGRQEQQVAGLMAVERRRVCRQRFFAGENSIDQLGDAQRQDRVHVVPQLPLRQHAVGPAAAHAQPCSKAIEERIEVVVLDDEDPRVGMRAIVLGEVPGDLQPQRRLARPFFAEDDRRARVGGIAVDLVPGGMIDAGDAVVFEDRIGLRIFLGKRIDADAVVLEELLNFHTVCVPRSLQRRG